MTAEMIELGRRAVVCKGWRWLPGMRWEAPSHGTDGRLEDWEAPTWGAHRGEDDTVPDFSDPATLGYLLALVREAWNDAEMHVMPTFTLETAEQEQAARQSLKPGERLPHEWTVYHGEQERFLAHDTEIAHGNTEAEALVAALEAVP